MASTALANVTSLADAWMRARRDRARLLAAMTADEKKRAMPYVFQKYRAERIAAMERILALERTLGLMPTKQLHGDVKVLNQNRCASCSALDGAHDRTIAECTAGCMDPVCTECGPVCGACRYIDNNPSS